MFIYTEEYLTRVRSCWDSFVKNGATISDAEDSIRPEILASWRRSKAYGVSYDGWEDDLYRLSAEETAAALNQNSALIAVADPYMRNIFSFVEGSNFAIHLTDRRGTVLRFLMSDHQIQEAIANHEQLHLGSVRDEVTMGTNSTSLCLVLQKPVRVFGEEHYIQCSQRFSCCSAPIFDCEERLCGVLTILGPKEYFHAHTMGMVCAAADGIQRGLRMQTANDELAIANKLLTGTIESLDSSILILNTDGRVVQLNQNAEKIFCLTRKDIIDRPVAQLINLTSIPEYIAPFEHDVQDVDVTLLTASGKKIDITLTTRIVRDKLEQSKTIVMIIKEQKAVHEYVSRVSGFSASYTFESILGNSEAINSVRTMGKHAAQSNSTVLILGESGCGKELLAQAIHNASKRANGPFVAVNCGALPKNLIESELFGYEGGAFTGARREGCPGKFELAYGGTIFLDEIGDMPLELQVTLLRVLQNKLVTRIGGRYQKKIDVRLIAATNSNLAEAVKVGTFRSDLYYRLNVFTVVMPPLRDRPDDILHLAEHFMRTYSISMSKNVTNIDGRVQALLRNYAWPGNVRELENTIERAINLTQGNTITMQELPQELRQLGERSGMRPPCPSVTDSASILSGESLGAPISPVFQDYHRVMTALEHERGHVSSAAQHLDLSVRQLYRKIKKYHIDLEQFRNWY